MGASLLNMIESLKKNWYLILLVFATTILGIIAVITAIRLYQLREKPVAPTVPLPAPAVEATPTPPCALTFCILSPTPTITPTPTGTVTPSPTPTSIATGTPVPTATPILQPTPTATLTPTSIPRVETTSTPTTYVAKVELPEAGFTLPTLGTVFGGIILVLTSLLLVL